MKIIVAPGAFKHSLTAGAAAEAAIGSPLLEDVNLTGARGILVNITAGLDLSIGEFEEVGNTVKAFASDNATVVVGTVIDPEMTDELRVTVVATGLERVGAVAVKPPEKPIRLIKKVSGEVDYDQLDRPTVIRKQAVGERFAAQSESSLDYLDIPAFLRRQAD